MTIEVTQHNTSSPLPPQNQMPKVVAEPRTNLDFAQSQQPNSIPVGQEQQQHNITGDNQCQ